MNTSPFTANPQDSEEAFASAGGKARALAALTRARFNVPPWFVVLPSACIVDASPGEPSLATSAAEELQRALDAFPSDTLFAVRSSAADEDGAAHSFAGQLDSFLFVVRDQVLPHIFRVWASGNSDRVRAYRRERGLPEIARAPAVIIQQMIEASSAGVAFSVDPVGGDRSIAVVSAVFGLGSGLVSGQCEADTWRVDINGTIVERFIRTKATAHRASSGTDEGVISEAVPESQQTQPAIDDTTAARVAVMSRECAAHFGVPQDIEWAFDAGRLWLLQSRPITSLQTVPDAGGAFSLWDNSNIAESYDGITTPLTFSFARGVYEEVYRQFCRILGVNESRIAASDGTFRCMLGFIRGRVYYNLLSWYRVLALLPGFHVNRRFMEQMMGVKQSLPDDVVAGIVRSSRRSKLADAIDLIACVLGLIRQGFGLRMSIRNFHRRLDDALAAPASTLADARLDQLAAEYRSLENRLLRHWDAPLVNDFFAMIFHGVLRKLCANWCGDSDGTLNNALVAAEGGIISAEPARRLADIARAIAPIPGLAATLQKSSAKDCHAALAQHPDVNRLVADYLAKFGERCLEELKLETLTLIDDPTLLYRTIGNLAERPPIERASASHFRTEAENRVAAALGSRPLRRGVFSWVLRNARERVKNRENLRFERTRVFGRVRRIFVETGRRLRAEGFLDSERDVFHLTVEEVLGFIEGTSVSWDLRSLVAVRQQEEKKWSSLAAPSGRFETRGAPPVGNAFRAEASTVPATTVAGAELRGIGCCPGIVEATARVILNPRDATIEPGEILVAPRTDPGWIMLFPAAAGLLVEHGSLLSHSAIVARELGIPAIVSIPDLTARVSTGQVIRMDGTTGLAVILQEA